MKENQQRIKKLMSKYRNNACTKEEFEELIVISQEEGNQDLFRDFMKEEWVEFMDLKEQESVKRGNLFKLPILVKVAASLLILISLGFVGYQFFFNQEEIYITGNGEVKNIQLPDGSEVKLNANSELIWKGNVNRPGGRIVELEGEAFFEVAKILVGGEETKEERYAPFRVITKDLSIDVLGTSFNVSSRNKNSEVFLNEGSVELLIRDREKQLMKPGEKITYDVESKVVTEEISETMSTSASWVNGVLNFHDETLGQVLENLTDIYGHRLTCKDTTLVQKRINLGVPYMDWDNTRKALEMAMEIEIEARGVIYEVTRKLDKE